MCEREVNACRGGVVVNARRCLEIKGQARRKQIPP